MAVLKKGARLTGAARESVTKTVTTAYANGKSIRDIATELGRSYGFVHRLLIESDQQMRSRGGATRRRRTEA